MDEMPTIPGPDRSGSIKTLPNGDTYISYGPPRQRIEDMDLPLVDRVALLVSGHDPQWDSAYDIAERIIATVNNEKEPK